MAVGGGRKSGLQCGVCVWWHTGEKSTAPRACPSMQKCHTHEGPCGRGIVVVGRTGVAVCVGNRGTPREGGNVPSTTTPTPCLSVPVKCKHRGWEGGGELFKATAENAGGGGGRKAGSRVRGGMG